MKAYITSWKESPFLAGAEALATIGTILSVFLFNAGQPIEGATIGAIANILWLYWSHETDSAGIFMVNLIMLSLNIFGLVK